MFEIYLLFFQPELVPDNFPHLFARHQPMAILFVDSKDVETKDAALASFSSLATSDLFPATIFCWMDAYVFFLLFVIKKCSLVQSI